MMEMVAMSLEIESSAPVAVGRLLPEGLGSFASPGVDVLCGRLVDLARQRRFCVKNQSRCWRSIEQFVAGGLGFSTKMEDAKQRKKLFDEARKIIKETLAERRFDADTGVMILHTQEAARVWDDKRASVENEMEMVAAQLPVAEFVKTVRGVSMLGLAVVVGEAGNLSNYPNRWTLQKRLGLGCLEDGTRQRRIKGLTQQQTLRIGYVPQRRGDMYAFFDDVMLRAQWRGAKDEDGKSAKKSKKPVVTPGYPLGPYGVYYERKLAEYTQEEHPAPHKAAARYMTKMFMRHLWREWKKYAREV
jgi:hypothetical protein